MYRNQGAGRLPSWTIAEVKKTNYGGHMYVITGATGNTGSVIAETLLAQGEKVRIISRSPERLGRFVEKGAEPFVADVTDTAALSRAFQGALAVYTMVPPVYNAADPLGEILRVGSALAAAVEKARVSYVVNLSSVGAHLAEKAGPVSGLHAVEQMLNRIAGANVLHVRAAFFLENLFFSIDLIKSMGIMGGSLRGDLPLPFIATRDIGAVAAEALRKRNFTGKQTRELLGQRDVTMSEIAAVIGKAIGKPELRYVQFSYAQAGQAMQQMGMSASVAKALNEMYAAINDGLMAPLEKRSAQNTTPTSIETFVSEVFLPRFKAKAAAGA